MVNAMIRNLILTLVVAGLVLFAAWRLWNSQPTGAGVTGEIQAEADYPRGPHNGRLLTEDGFALEITIFETGVPPEFRVYPYYLGEAVDPARVDLTIELGRTGGVLDSIPFRAQGDTLRGEGVVTEPHSFDVTVTAEFQGKRYEWRYASYEGRTVIPEALAREAGIQTETAGPATIVERLALTGSVAVDPNRVSQVRPRFPGVIKQVHVSLGDRVEAGDELATIESSESLQDYTVTAPIGGLVIRRGAQAGEVTGIDPLFTLVDLSRVWVELDVFARQLRQVRKGQAVRVRTLDGYTATGAIDWLSPISSNASQSVTARVPLDNPGDALRPGQFVQAEIAVDAHEVPLAVRRAGVQAFRDFQVVYAKFDDTYEVRMLDFGVTNEEWMEVTGGLAPGTEYVTGNSYLIKADIEKSGATHDH